MTTTRARILTFGCRANQYETAMMYRRLGERVPPPEEADVCVLNACAVTALAERKARQAARRMRREHPGCPVVVIGCLADTVAHGWTPFPDADLLAGNAWKPRIDEVVARAAAGARGLLPTVEPPPIGDEVGGGSPGRIRAVLKIQDGCSRACTYCRPTQIRGTSRSKATVHVVAEAAELVRSGHPEIVLTGINLSQYDVPGGSLADVARDVLGVPGVTRLRLASLNAAALTESLIGVFATDRRACPHFHVPLQSGDDRILERMQRGYTADDYLRRIDAVRTAIPHATFGTDIIVGFPGEGDDAFARTLDLVERVGFVNLHLFRFSPRPGTAAFDLPDRVPSSIQRERAERLRRRWRERLAGRLDNRIGTIDHVLVEERRSGSWRGYTSDYLYVHFTSEEDIPVGSVRPVRIVAATDEHLEGTAHG